MNYKAWHWNWVIITCLQVFTLVTILSLVCGRPESLPESAKNVNALNTNEDSDKTATITFSENERDYQNNYKYK